MATLTKDYSIPFASCLLVNFVQFSILTLIKNKRFLNRIFFANKILILWNMSWSLFIRLFEVEYIFPDKSILYFLNSFSILRKHAKKRLCILLVRKFFTIIFEKLFSGNIGQWFLPKRQRVAFCIVCNNSLSISTSESNEGSRNTALWP